ncbi:MAG TPA: hypothetical protein VFZ65_14770 [Planctomycetota bacterium]|nr:hypothetical protein [Planctomycetota bacterium]
MRNRARDGPLVDSYPEPSCHHRTLALFIVLLTSCLAAQTREPRLEPDRAPPPTAVEIPPHPRIAQEPVTPTHHIETRLGICFAVATSKIRRAIIRTTTQYGFAVRSVGRSSR